MNQILITNLDKKNADNENVIVSSNEFNNYNKKEILDNYTIPTYYTNYTDNKIEKNKKFFKLQFIFSILIIFTTISFSIYYIYSLKNREKISENIIGNYNIYRLYANNEGTSEKTIDNNLFGIIEIPKINLYYPIFSTLSEENLKVSPCKFYGSNLEENTNICIAGHNYNNDLFFSQINQLQPQDEIYIYDYTGVKYTYQVTENYEVKEDDLSPIYIYNENQKNLTLITCNNLNNNRIIIKAIQ